MRKQIIPVILLFLSLTEIVSLFFFALQDTENRQDMILINEAVQSIQNSWNTLEMYEDKTGLDYVVLNQKGTVVAKNVPLSASCLCSYFCRTVFVSVIPSI